MSNRLEIMFMFDFLKLREANQMLIAKEFFSHQIGKINEKG
jgi:hypothetical protein